MHDDIHDSLARARLHALIGTAVCHLPAHFVAKLDRILAENRGEPLQPPASIRLTLVRSEDDEAMAKPAGEPCGRQHEAAFLHDKVRGLAAILDMLHAAHLDRRENAASPALGEHLVEGLILAGRELVGAMALEPTQGRLP